MNIFYPNPSLCSPLPLYTPPIPYPLLLLLLPHVPRGTLHLAYLLHGLLLLFVEISIVIPTPHIDRLYLGELLGLLLLQLSQFKGSSARTF